MVGKTTTLILGNGEGVYLLAVVRPIWAGHACGSRIIVHEINKG
jgi:hypothetical protein